MSNMATTVSYSKTTGTGPLRKKIKTSDLPLASATRAAIEGLSYTFKKKGGYDALRKQIWEDLEKTSFETEFSESLLNVADIEIEKNDCHLLRQKRSTAVALIEGAVERAGLYRDAEERIDALIDRHIEKIEIGIRAIRARDVGEDVAALEQARGGKTDEQYAEEAANKREAREKARQEARDKKKVELEEARREERAKRKEEEKRAEAEQEKRRAEREARRKAEREREEEKERNLKERERARDRERDDRHRKHENESRRNDSVRESKESKDYKTPGIKAELSQEEIERLEEEALHDLLKPARRGRHQLDLEVDETLAPPPRKTMPTSAINPISRDSTLKQESRKPSLPPKMPKADQPGFKTMLPGEVLEDDRLSTRDRKRSRSRDRTSTRRSSRSRSRHRRDSRDRYRSRRDSRERSGRTRDDRRRDNSKDRDDRHRDRHRRSSRDRSDRHKDDKRNSYRSESVSREKEDAAAASRKKVCDTHHISRGSSLEFWKVAEAKKREQEAKEYLAAKNEALARGVPFAYGGYAPTTKREILTPQPKEDVKVSSSPVSTRRRDLSRDRERRARSRSRSTTGRRTSRIERSTSPLNIDRYVPGASGRSHRDNTSARNSTRKRDRSRSRDRDRERECKYSRDEERSHRNSRSRSRRRERSRDRSRDRDRTKRRSRSRSPRVRRERDSRRERSRSREKESRKYRDRSRSRDRDHERDRERKRSKRDY